VPRYAYQCPNGHNSTVYFPMGEAEHTVPCRECSKLAERVFTSPQLNTRPFLLHPENKFAWGFSETERTATRKADDIAYNKHWK
jgi:hypothetical protein